MLTLQAAEVHNEIMEIIRKDNPMTLEQQTLEALDDLINSATRPQSQRKNREDAMLEMIATFFDRSEVNVQTLNKIISFTTSGRNKILKEHRAIYPREVVKKTWIDGYYRSTYSQDVWPTDQS